MSLTTDSRYSTYSLSIVLYLIHNNEDYKNLWCEKYPNAKQYAENFFKDENCGCRPGIIKQYKLDRFHADIMTVEFINKNKDCLNFDEFEKIGKRDISGHVFSIPKSEGHYQDFLASLQQKNTTYSHFNTTVIDDKILVTFF